MTDDDLLTELERRIDADPVFRLTFAMTVEHLLPIYEVYPEHVRQLRTLSNIWVVLRDIEAEIDREKLIDALAARAIANCTDD